MTQLQVFKVILLCSNLPYLLVLCLNCWIYSCQNCWSIRKESNCSPVSQCGHFWAENIYHIESTIPINAAMLIEPQYQICSDSKVAVVEVWHCFLKLTYEKCKACITCFNLSNISYYSCFIFSAVVQQNIPKILQPQIRTVTKFSLKKGKRKTVKTVIRRFFRLAW